MGKSSAPIPGLPLMVYDEARDLRPLPFEGVHGMAAVWFGRHPRKMGLTP